MFKFTFKIAYKITKKNLPILENSLVYFLLVEMENLLKLPKTLIIFT